MSGHDNGAPVAQPAHFEFMPENLETAKRIIAKYPPGRQASAVLPLLTYFPAGFTSRNPFVAASVARPDVLPCPSGVPPEP